MVAAPLDSSEDVSASVARGGECAALAVESASLSSTITRALSSSTPVAVRMRAIFALKAHGGAAAVGALASCMRGDASVLVKHEAAYVLGQMRDVSALPALEEALRDEGEDVVVRHEAAEAMGAIGDRRMVTVLEEFADERFPREIYETCRLSIALLGMEGEGGDGSAAYSSVDPAPAGKGRGIAGLREVLCDGRREMFERYRAMFGLRDVGGEEAVKALCDGMRGERESALFRHEVAFVLGQMQSPVAVETLAAFLRDKDEHEMVRHEAAEALGSIATEESERLLREFRDDENDVVRESVAVALDISEYVSDESKLHYADAAAE